ncbi:MAG: nucleotide exchange factor GrpE [Bacilli bacterium]
MINDKKNEKKDDKNIETDNKNIDKGSNKLQVENDELKGEVAKWKNEYYKAYADMANLRKDIEKDQKEAFKYRIEGFTSDLVNVLDAFDMAFKNEPKTDEMKNYLIGFRYVHNQMLDILDKEGVKQINPKINDKFDEKVMHAVETIDDEGEENLVKNVTLKGYKLYDHLIRPAMVVVSKHPAKKVDDAKDVKDDKKEDK